MIEETCKAEASTLHRYKSRPVFQREGEGVRHLETERPRGPPDQRVRGGLRDRTCFRAGQRKPKSSGREGRAKGQRPEHLRRQRPHGAEVRARRKAPNSQMQAVLPTIWNWGWMQVQSQRPAARMRRTKTSTWQRLTLSGAAWKKSVQSTTILYTTIQPNVTKGTKSES